MRNAIALIAGLISFASILPYVRDVYRGKTHPNLVSWLTWCMLNLINTTAAISTGATQTALLSGASALATGWITVISLRRGVKHYTAFDIACQAIAIGGIITWKVTGQPGLAVLFAVSIDLVAAMPTWRHAWVAPHAETWQGFAIAAGTACLTLTTIANYNFVSLAFPILVITNCSIIVTIILSRRAMTSERPAPRIAS